MRKVKTVAFLQSLFQPLKESWEQFLIFKKQAEYKVTHTSQVCYIEAAINDVFDNSARRIFIKNGLFLSPLYVYTPEEDKPLYTYSEAEQKPLYTYSEADLNQNDVDFIVCVPIELKPAVDVALNSYLSRMKSIINYYKLASKTYSIEWIN